MLIIGIDTGTKTGFAVYDTLAKELVTVKTLKIHQAMAEVYALKQNGSSIFVRVEDARKRQWFGTGGREKLQGAGSIKRDAVIWEDFLKDIGVPFEMVAPKSVQTKVTVAYFRQVTKYVTSTSQHGRDAAMIIYGWKMAKTTTK